MRIRTPWIFAIGAGVYDAITDQDVWRAHCRKMAAFVPEETVIDLGIGPGVSGIAMAQASPGMRLVGVDLSEQMIQRAKKHVAKAGVYLPLVRCDALRLPFPDGSFGGATGHSFLYLTHDSDAILREIHRVVRPGGRVAFLEPNRDLGLFARLRSVVRAFGGGLRFGTSMFLWTIFSGLHGRYAKSALTAQLERCGFADARATETLSGLGLFATAVRT